MVLLFVNVFYYYCYCYHYHYYSYYYHYYDFDYCYQTIIINVVIVNICLNHDCICLIYSDSFQIEFGDEHLSANGSTIQVNLRKLGE